MLDVLTPWSAQCQHALARVGKRKGSDMIRESTVVFLVGIAWIASACALRDGNGDLVFPGGPANAAPTAAVQPPPGPQQSPPQQSLAAAAPASAALDSSAKQPAPATSTTPAPDDTAIKALAQRLQVEHPDGYFSKPALQLFFAKHLGHETLQHLANSSDAIWVSSGHSALGVGRLYCFASNRLTDKYKSKRNPTNPMSRYL
jgi:hypothetical protein